MKNIKSVFWKSKKFILALMGLLMIQIISFSCFAANTQYATGGLPYSAEDIKWMQDNMIQTKDVSLNSIGLKRVNEFRKVKGLSEVSSSSVVPIGNEVSSVITASSGVTAQDLFTLPDTIDNSDPNKGIKCFPPIMSQGDIGSCSAAASTYYLMSHMTGLARNWTVNDASHRFSPKWTHNLVKTTIGFDTGIALPEAYSLILNHGSVLESDNFKYDGSKINPLNYLEWPKDSQLWKNALNFRMKTSGFVPLASGDTSITSASDPDLTNIKKLLANGYVLNVVINAYQLKNGTIQIKNYSANAIPSNSYAGQLVCPYIATGDYLHSVTLVGYNDNIWTDINGNNQIDAGEMGAFKIANSWGTAYGNQGYIWLAYDALNKVSSVTGASQNASRISAFDRNEAYWVTARESYTPILEGEFTINHLNRKQLTISLGYSANTSSVPTVLWNSPFVLNSIGGDYRTNGNPTSSGSNPDSTADITVVYDFSDLIINNGLMDTSTKRFYVIGNDNLSDNYSLQIKKFNLINGYTNQIFSSTNTFPVSANNSTVNVWCDYSPTIPVNKIWTIVFSSNILQSTINSTNIYVLDNSNNKVNVTLSPIIGKDSKCNTLTISPGSNYVSGGKYSINITTSVKSESGKNLVTSKKIYFVVK